MHAICLNITETDTTRHNNIMHFVPKDIHSQSLCMALETIFLVYTNYVDKFIQHG